MSGRSSNQSTAKLRPRRPKPVIELVDDEQPAAAVAEGAQAGQEATLRRPVAGGAEDGLDDDRRDTVELGGGGVQVGERGGAILAAVRVAAGVVLLAPRVRERVHPVDPEADPFLWETAAAEPHPGGLAVEAAGEGDEVATAADRLGEAHGHLDGLGATRVQRDPVDARGQHAGEVSPGRRRARACAGRRRPAAGPASPPPRTRPGCRGRWRRHPSRWRSRAAACRCRSPGTDPRRG